jgi:hypothetical protein
VRSSSQTRDQQRNSAPKRVVARSRQESVSEHGESLQLSRVSPTHSTSSSPFLVPRPRQT